MIDVIKENNNNEYKEEYPNELNKKNLLTKPEKGGIPAKEKKKEIKKKNKNEF